MPETSTSPVVITASALKAGDVVVDEHGARKFAAFDVDAETDRVKVWTAVDDQLNGWPRVLEFELHDVLAVVR